MTISRVAEALRATKLKDMDSASLAFAIVYEADTDTVDETPLRDSLALAAAAHLTQTRSGHGQLPIDPYVIHPLRNVLRLIRIGCKDTAVLCATALHDTVEDQPERIVSLLSGDDSSPGASTAERALELIAAHFGSETSRLVAAVTNPPATSGLSRDEKNAAYRDHVADVIEDPRVYLVKYADFIDNAGSVYVLDDGPQKDRLRAKYAPLVAEFESRLHSVGTDLGIGERGVEAIGARLVRLTESLSQVTVHAD